ARVRVSFPGSISPRLADALPRRPSHGLPRRPRLLHTRRFQAVSRLRLRPPRSRKLALHLHPEKIRASRASVTRDRGERAGAGIGFERVGTDAFVRPSRAQLGPRPRAYSPEATGGVGCKLESREIVATIIPERNCIVATSLLSNACGVDDSTSKTPSVRRKCRSGATRIELTPIPRQVAQSTRGFVSASLQSNTSPVRTHSAESPLSVCRRTPISGAVRPVRARQTISLPRRNAIAAPVAPVNTCAFSAMML